MIRTALLVAGNDLRRRLRDRSMIVFAVVAPLVLAGIVSLAFGGPEDFGVDLAVVDEDGSEASAAVVGRLEALRDTAPIHVDVVGSVADARDRVDDDDVGAAVVLGAGFGTGEGTVGVITAPKRPTAAAVADGIAATIASRVDASRLAATTAIQAGADPAEAIEAAASIAPAIELDDVAVGGDYSIAAYMAPAMAILFLFFAVGLAAQSLLVEEREGTLARVRAAPVRGAAVVAGKALAVVVVALTSFVVVWVASTLLMGASWGDPLGVVLVVVATVIAVAGVSAVLAGWARTEAQADGLTTAVALVFALLGGTFVPIAEMPDALRAVSLATPNGWALRALDELSAGEGAVGDVLVHVAVLTAVGLVTGAVGLASVGRRIAR